MSELTGKTLSSFRVVERLDGAGPPMVSYRAEDTESHSPVMLKILPDELSPEERKRVIAMARAASKLDHPNVEALLEIGETDDGHLFWCSGWHPGETLDRWLDHGKLTAGDALDICVQMATGLESSHRARIAHGALRPDQIKLHDSQRVEILGFGLCAAAGEGMAVKFGEPLAALAYRSPEQIRGDRVGPRTDVWSLGVILYEMLAGRRPFEGSTVGALAEGILGGSPPPISKLCKGIPQELDAVLTRALAKEVGARFSGITALKIELEPFAAKLGEPVRGTLAPETAAEPPPEKNAASESKPSKAKPAKATKKKVTAKTETTATADTESREAVESEAPDAANDSAKVSDSKAPDSNPTPSSAAVDAQVNGLSDEDLSNQDLSNEGSAVRDSATARWAWIGGGTLLALAALARFLGIL